jgi:transposase InsO family protein
MLVLGLSGGTNNGKVKEIFSRTDHHEDRKHNGVKFRILNIINEFARECLAVRVGRSLTHRNVLEVLTELFYARGVPVHIRSDNGSEFTAKRVRAWLKRLDVKPLFIEPGSPWENGDIESFNYTKGNTCVRAGEQKQIGIKTFW